MKKILILFFALALITVNSSAADKKKDEKVKEKTEKIQESKENKGNKNAYGKDKEELSGKEFGQERANSKQKKDKVKKDKKDKSTTKKTKNQE